MEKAYIQAVDHLGGLDRAKPKPILEQLAAEFPDLTLLVRRLHRSAVAGAAGDSAVAGSPSPAKTRLAAPK
jgi:hypothetical protein